ncbi:MAG TPA: DUF1257 domain-containing protein [Anaerolineales bacterium]|nr:DUF1257 domain-containing protein [Anaerolineales bacterium]
MSVYKEIKTEFKNPESLLAALADLGAKFTCANPIQNESRLESNWHGLPSENVAIAINRDEARRLKIGGFDGLGFRWTGSGYSIVQDNLDRNDKQIQTTMNQLQQRYTFHAVSAKAKSKGYTVVEKQGDNGEIFLTLRKR